jgi:hypothetical protein
LSFSGRLSLLWPGFVSKKHSRLRHSLMSWEYLALGVLQPHSTTQNTVSGPHAVLVVDEHENRPETCPTHSPAYPLNFPATRQAVSLGAPLGRHASRSSPGIKSRHLTRSTHGTPTLPAKFAEEDVAPHLHEDECWSATRGAGGDDVSTRKAQKPQEARSGRIGRAPQFRLTRN